jgi:hypothetical protein
VIQVLRNARGVAPPLREGPDPVRAGGGVVDRAEHKMKSPEHFVTRELGQAFAKRVDKLGFGCGDELFARLILCVPFRGGQGFGNQGRLGNRTVVPKSEQRAPVARSKVIDF